MLIRLLETVNAFPENFSNSTPGTALLGGSELPNVPEANLRLIIEIPSDRRYPSIMIIIGILRLEIE